jgi:hypothetical protein
VGAESPYLGDDTPVTQGVKTCLRHIN